MAQNLFDDELAALRAEYVDLDTPQQEMPMLEAMPELPKVQRVMRKKTKKAPSERVRERKKSKTTRALPSVEGNYVIKHFHLFFITICCRLWS